MRSTATRFRAGTISLISSSHLAARLYSYIMNPVTLPPGLARLSTIPGSDGIAHHREHDRHSPRVLQQWTHGGGAVGQHDVRPQRDQLRRVTTNIAGDRSGPANLEMRVLALDPPRLLQCHHEGADLFPCEPNHHRRVAGARR